MPNSRSVHIVEFGIADRHGGLLAADVLEVVRAAALTPLSRAPRVIEGIVNVRGSIVPVIDLRTRFGLKRRAIAPTDLLIVARAGERRIAIRVDTIGQVMAIERRHIEEELQAGPCADTIAGVAKLPDGLLVLHDISAFLTATEQDELDRALAAEGGQ